MVIKKILYPVLKGGLTTGKKYEGLLLSQSCGLQTLEPSARKRTEDSTWAALTSFGRFWCLLTAFPNFPVKPFHKGSVGQTSRTSTDLYCQVQFELTGFVFTVGPVRPLPDVSTRGRPWGSGGRERPPTHSNRAPSRSNLDCSFL